MRALLFYIAVLPFDSFVNDYVGEMSHIQTKNVYKVSSEDTTTIVKLANY